MYLLMSICDRTENKRHLNSINVNAIFKCNLTGPWI
jgi:hypothetical protein